MSYSAVITVAGTTFRQRELEGLRPLDPVKLVREPENPHDPNAIKVMCLGRHVGYIPATISVDLAGLIDQTGQVPTANVEQVTQYRPHNNPRTVNWGLQIRIYTPEESNG